MRHFDFILISLLFFVSCDHMIKHDTQQEPNTYQKSLLEKGWVYSNMPGAEMIEGYGYEPQYGLVDNYFDIKLGEGSDCIIKIMDYQSNKCIRQALIKGGSSTTISQIPQQKVFLKIAYGKDLMEFKSDSSFIWRFTNDAFFERSATVFDFGKKNSQEIINYTLEIRVQSGTCKNSFETIPISEEEFFK